MLMSHERQKLADNGRFLSADKNRPISCHTFEIFLLTFCGCGVNMDDSDEEASAAFLGTVA